MSQYETENVRMIMNTFQKRDQRCSDRRGSGQTENYPQTCRQKTVGEAQTESGTKESGGQTRGTDIQVRGYGQSV